jgi:hypothetical protein
MSTPANFSYRWQEILEQHERLRHFKARLPESVVIWLGDCEWTLIPNAGQGGMALMALRCPGRIRLSNPMLLQLAESAQASWGPLDFSLFSAETPEPIRVLSQTLVDLGRRR